MGPQGKIQDQSVLAKGITTRISKTDGNTTVLKSKPNRMTYKLGKGGGVGSGLKVFVVSGIQNTIGGPDRRGGSVLFVRIGHGHLASDKHRPGPSKRGDEKPLEQGFGVTHGKSGGVAAGCT